MFSIFGGKEVCGLFLFLLKGRGVDSFYYEEGMGGRFIFGAGRDWVFFLRGIGFSFSFRGGGALLFVEGFRAGFFFFSRVRGRGWDFFFFFWGVAWFFF